MRFFRVIRMAKRAGRGQDPAGFGGTPPGGLAVECPACPKPDKNMPAGLKVEDVPQNEQCVYSLILRTRRCLSSVRYLYTQFYAVDANFKLKMKAHGYQDVALADGLAYFVETKHFKDTLVSLQLDKVDVEVCAS